MTDLVVSEGYAAVGYEYINIDDCWLEKKRSYSGQLVPDRLRFPYGLRDLSDYVSYSMHCRMFHHIQYVFIFMLSKESFICYPYRGIFPSFDQLFLYCVCFHIFQCAGFS